MMMQIDRARALFLPDGSHVKVETHGGSVNAHDQDDRNWKSLDISLIRANGREEILCCVDYEDKKGLRVLVFDGSSETPVFEREAGYAKAEKPDYRDENGFSF